jgi:hypothetical protein
MKQYFYSDGKEQFGPISFEELKDKNITAETLIWFEGLEEWISAKHVQEIKEFFEVTPPLLSTDNVPEINTTIPPPLNVSVVPENNKKADDFLEKLGENNGIPQKKKINNTLANTLAVLACIVFYFIWFALWTILESLVLGWQSGNNGGGIYVGIKFALLIVCLRAIWKKIKSYSK